MNFDDLIREWNTAGKSGGIPDDLPVVVTVSPGDDIQAAINAAAAQGGGVVLLEEGTYRVNESINLKSDVVLRGADREKTVIESTIRSNDGDATIELDNLKNAGIENLTLDYVALGYDPDPHAYTNTPGGNDNNIETGHINLSSSASHSWVKDVNVFNAGTDPINVDGHYNTFTGNVVEGAYMKGGGGNGYYRVRGDHNLFENETVSEIRHFAIMDTADHNVVVDSHFTVDINFHSGDSGSNLIEGNTLDVPAGHYWFPIAIGHSDYGHRPPGPNNVIVNNDISHERDWFSLDLEEDTIYSYFGFNSEGGTRQRPAETDWELPPGGEFYTANNNQPEPAQVIPEPAPEQKAAAQQKIIQEEEPEEVAAPRVEKVSTKVVEKAEETATVLAPEPTPTPAKVVTKTYTEETAKIPEPVVSEGPALAPEVTAKASTQRSDDAASLGEALSMFGFARESDKYTYQEAPAEADVAIVTQTFFAPEESQGPSVPQIRTINDLLLDTFGHGNNADADWMVL